MKKLFILILVLISFDSFSQLYQVLPQYGYQMPRVDARLVLKIPSDTTTNKTGVARIGTVLYAGNGTYWTAAGGTAGWGLTGNGSTVAGTNFVGTTDSVDLVGKTKGLERFRWNARGALGVGTGTDFGTAGYLLSTNGSSTAPTWVNPSGIGRRFGVSGEDATAAQNRLFISSGYPFQIGALNGNKEQLFRILVDSSMGMYLRTNTSSDLAFVYLNGADSSINLKGGREVHGSGMRIADNGIFHTPYLGNFYIDTLTSAVGTKALRYNPGTGLVTYADTTTTAAPSLTATYIGYGDGSNLLTGSSEFNVNISDYSLRLGNGDLTPSNVNFLGANAGNSATNAAYSNFLGLSAGGGATNAAYSNFLGLSAGGGATNAANSNFLGASAGKSATNAANSIFIGQNAGNSDAVDNTGNTDDYSILIGQSTSTGGYKNSVAIGGYATNTAENEMMIGSSTRPLTLVVPYGNVGINTSTPTVALDVVGDTKLTSSATTTTGLDVSSSTITSGALATFTNTGTAAASNTKTVGKFYTSGANATSTQTTYGVDISNTNTGTSSTNVALRAAASGATNNYAALFTGNVGVGTSTPTARTEIVGGTLGTNLQSLLVTGTQTSGSAFLGNWFNMTSAGSSGASLGTRFTLGAGYTGGSATTSLEVYNAVAGTGTNMQLSSGFATPGINGGFIQYVSGSTTGTNVGGYSDVTGGNTNYGVVGKTVGTKNSAANIAVLGVSRNAGTSPIEIGGYFGMQTTEATIKATSVALAADNGATTANIFEARDGGTSIFTIADGGEITTALKVTDGANKSVGVSAAMTAGTITISNTRVTANSRIFLTHATLGGTQGILSVGTITAGTSFVINSSSATDTGTVNWLIVN